MATWSIETQCVLRVCDKLLIGACGGSTDDVQDAWALTGGADMEVRGAQAVPWRDATRRTRRGAGGSLATAESVQAARRTRCDAVDAQMVLAVAVTKIGALLQAAIPLILVKSGSPTS